MLKPGDDVDFDGNGEVLHVTVDPDARPPHRWRSIPTPA